MGQVYVKQIICVTGGIVKKCLGHNFSVEYRREKNGRNGTFKIKFSVRHIGVKQLQPNQHKQCKQRQSAKKHAKQRQLLGK